MKTKLEMKKQATELITALDEGILVQKENNFEKWVIKKIEKKFGRKVSIDKRISESAKQI